MVKTWLLLISIMFTDIVNAHIVALTDNTRFFSDSSRVNSQSSNSFTNPILINDNAPGAISITVDAGCIGAIYTNLGATQSVGEPAGSCSSATGYSTVWFKFTAPPGGAVRISTATGVGNTLNNTRVALFSASDVNDYGTFSLIACDEDGGSGSFASMSVLYATGLITDNTYYVQVDKFDLTTLEGTFCLTVNKLDNTMLSAIDNCNSVYQVPVGAVASYKGWVSLMDDDSKLIALVKNPAGGPVNAYTIAQNINASAVRRDITSGEYYLNRSYTINNTASPGATLNAQFFFLATELAALTSVDPAASLSRIGVTKQTASACRPDFVTANGTNSELSQTGNGVSGGVNWITTNISGYSNFYIHAIKSYLTAKVFLQGAYDANLGRHKDVTTTWANILNTYAKNQPYNNNLYPDTAHEGYGATTPGGRGKPVYHVTNLNASGAGSFLAALGSNRTVVFDVGGTINNFSWYASAITNLTIDGSTAPVPGITLNSNQTRDCLTFDDLSHDIIVKNIRVRNATNDGIGVFNSYNILFDHISVSGSGDGDLDITGAAHDVTVQWSIFGPGKPTWSGTMLIAYPGTKSVSLHHNLYASYGSGTGERDPLVHNATNNVPNPVTYLMADFTNNIVWKWGHSNGSGGFGSCADYGGTLQARNNFYQSIQVPGNAIVVNYISTDAKLYASGNVSGNSGVNPNSASNVASPWTVPAVTTQDPCTAAALVLERSGPRPLDETDQALINQVSLANCQDFQNTTSYTGTESVANGFFTSTTATTDITDWVMLEIKNSAGSMVARRAAFVREDGHVVDLDGVSTVFLQSLASGNYYLTIRHRNHLSISTQNLLSFTAKALGVSSGVPANFDFTAATDADIFGDAVAYKTVNGVNLMIAGNANGNNNVRYAGIGNDPASILLFLNGAIGGIISNVYSANDINMDGTIRYAGVNNDVGFLLSNSLGGAIGAIVVEQKR